MTTDIADRPRSGSCLNCGNSFHGPFCANCGQRTDTGKLRVLTWTSDVLGVATTLESGFARTVVDLTLRPGETVRRYVAGQRIRFTSPIRYAVFAAGLWVVAFSIANASLASEPSLASSFVKYGQLLNLAALPLMAAAFLMAFRGSGFSYAEELCLASYLGGHVFLWRAALAALSALSLPAPLLNGADQVLFLLYSTWMMWSFHSGRVRWMPVRLLVAWAGIILVSVIVSLPFAASAKLESSDRSSLRNQDQLECVADKRY